MASAATCACSRTWNASSGNELTDVTVADRGGLARMPGPESAPQLDAERCQALPPWAVALEVEDAWTGTFSLAVGATAAAAAERSARDRRRFLAGCLAHR